MRWLIPLLIVSTIAHVGSMRVGADSRDVGFIVVRSSAAPPPPGAPSVWIDVDNLDGLNNSTLTNGVEFSSTTIVNRGSLGGTFAGTTGAAPTFVSSCVGRGSRKPCLRFDGVDDGLLSSLPSSSFRFMHEGPSTCYVVGEPVNPGVTGVPFYRTVVATTGIVTTDTGISHQWLDYQSRQMRIRNLQYDGTAPAALIVSTGDDVMNQQTWASSGSVYNPGAAGNDFGVYTLGVLRVSGEPTAPLAANPTMTLSIGKSGANGGGATVSPWRGNIRGLVCYASALDAAGVAALESWATSSVTSTPYAAGACATASPKLCGAQSPCRVGVMGDSLSFTIGAVTKEWPDVLRDLVGSAEFVLLNEGVSASTIIDGATTQWSTRLKQAGLTSLIIFQGRNDIDFGQTAAATLTRVAAVADDAIADGLNVLTISTLPSGFPAGVQVEQDAFNAGLASAAGGCRQHLDVYADFENSPGSDTLLAAYDLGDGVHLNQTGHDALAAAVLPLVGP